LRDPQGRVLGYLRLGVTDRCDLRCAYCNVEGARREATDELSLGDLATIGVAFGRRLGFRKVRLTGGEPLLRADLPEVVRRMCGEAGFARVALTTNGRLLARCVRDLVAAGVDRINVSLDTLCAGSFQEIRGADAFADVTAGIDAALDAGLPRVKVNVVLLRSHGFREFESFLSWGAGRPLDVRFIELMPIDGLADFHRREAVSSAPLVERVRELGFVPAAGAGDGGPAAIWERPGDPMRVGFVAPITRPFCDRCNRLRVTPRGALKLCLFGRGHVDLRPLLPAGPGAVAEAVHRAVALREEGLRPVGGSIEGATGMRGIGG